MAVLDQVSPDLAGGEVLLAAPHAYENWLHVKLPARRLTGRGGPKSGACQKDHEDRCCCSQLQGSSRDLRQLIDDKIQTCKSRLAAQPKRLYTSCASKRHASRSSVPVHFRHAEHCGTFRPVNTCSTAVVICETFMPNIITDSCIAWIQDSVRDSLRRLFLLRKSSDVSPWET